VLANERCCGLAHPTLLAAHPGGLRSIPVKPSCCSLHAQPVGVHSVKRGSMLTGSMPLIRPGSSTATTTASTILLVGIQSTSQSVAAQSARHIPLLHALHAVIKSLV
jgi:hypothetical protein